MNQQKKDWYSLDEIYKTPEFKKYITDRGFLRHGLESATNYYEKLIAIKNFYLSNQEQIINKPTTWACAYPTDWSLIFSPIELMAWQSIRAKGKIILYPQYPALNYFLDFGNPGLKVALELDGKYYHNQDKDFIRDMELKKNGWNVYRITGSEMYKADFKEITEIESEYYYEDRDEDKAIEDLRYWLLKTGDGIIQAIKEVHFQERGFRLINENVEERYRTFCYQTLDIHQNQ